MKVYYPGAKARLQQSFTMSVAPAATIQNQEVPVEWVDDQNNPVQFNVEFVYGEAEVPDALGRYLIENELARKTKLILPGDALAQPTLFDQGG